MVLDTRIAMGVQPLDVGASIGRGYQLRDLAMQAETRKLDNQAKQWAVQKQATLGDLYKGSLGADGSVDRAKLTQGMIGAGYGADLPELQKGWGEMDKAQAESRSKMLENGIKANNYITSQIAGLMMKQDRSPADAYAAIDHLAQIGILLPEQAQQYRLQVPTNNPQAMDNWLRTMLVQSLEGKEQLAAMMPKVSAQNLGGHTQMVDTNPLTNPSVVGQRLERSATPGDLITDRHNRATEGLQARGQNMTDARARDQMRGQIVTDANGGVQLVNPITGEARPVTGAGGEPVIGKGGLSAKQLENSRAKKQTVDILKKQIENLKAARANLVEMDYGIVAGRQSVTDTARAYDAALAAAQTTVRQLTRTPGEGAMSDYESRMSQAQLPNRVDPIEVIDQKIGQLEDMTNIIEEGYTEILGRNGNRGSGSKGNGKVVDFSDLK